MHCSKFLICLNYCHFRNNKIPSENSNSNRLTANENPTSDVLCFLFILFYSFMGFLFIYSFIHLKSSIVSYSIYQLFLDMRLPFFFFFFFGICLKWVSKERKRKRICLKYCPFTCS